MPTLQKSGSAGNYMRVDEEVRHEGGTKTFKCPRLTRCRVTFISFFVVVAVVFFVYTCTKTLGVSPASICSLVQSQKVSVNLPPENTPASAVESERRHPAHTRRRLPQCIIIGVRKGGTRALLRFLNLHPNIQAAGREIHFFDDDYNYSLGYDWYRKKMPFSYANQITMEKSPAYFVSEKVPERVWKMNHSVSLILIVRDPVQRTISDYAQLMYNKIDRGKTFKRFEDNAIDPVTGEINVHYAAIRRSVYHRHMARWLNFFHLRQFLIVSGEELVDDPVRVIKKVEDFLGLEHRVGQNFFYFNETRGFYCVREDYKESCLANSKGRPHPEINPVVIKKLRRFFRGHNEKFFKLVNQRFDWPTD